MKKFFSILAAALVSLSMFATTVTFDFTDTSFLTAQGFTLPGEGAGTDLNGQSFTTGGVTISFVKGTGTTTCRIYQGSGSNAGKYDVRTYAGDVMTISVAGTDKINEVQLGASMTCNDEPAATHTFPEGVASAAFTGKATLKTVKVIINETVTEWTPDTLSVTEARALIASNSPLMAKSHYVKGIISSDNFGSTWPGYAMIWMRDITNETDTLEGYKIYKDANQTKFNEGEVGCLGDTVMLYADGLAKYNTIFETTSGYLVKNYGGGVCTTPTMDTLTVAEAMAKGQALADNAESEKVCVIGYAVKLHTEGYVAVYGYQTVFMSDDPTATDGEFQVYKCNVAAPGVAQGDKIAVIGKILKYVGTSGTPTIEIKSGDMEVIEHATAVENIESAAKTIKVIENGQMVIIRNGVRFNAAGARL